MAISTPDSLARLTLLELAERLPKAPSDAHESYVDAGRDDAFLEVGKKIATERVLTDCKRLYAEAYLAYDVLTKEQRAEFVGFSLELLAFAVATALAHDEKNRAFDQAADASKQLRAGADAELASVRSRALARRDQAYAVLKSAAAGSARRLAALDEAVGTAESEESLARGVRALAALATSWLDEPKGTPLRKRLAIANVTAAYPKALEATARSLDDVAVAASARGTSTPLTQQQLDHDDGLNLFLLGQIVDAFDAAHDVDPTIPRLVPHATRRLLRPARTSKPQPVTPDPKPAS